MKKKVYDTRFFMEYFYTSGKDVLKRMKTDLQNTKNRYVSVITLHEIFNLVLKKEGEEVAKLRVKVVEKDFKVINVNKEIAISSAKIRFKYHIPLADSIIVATAQKIGATVITDDPHFEEIREIKTKWF